MKAGSTSLYRYLQQHPQIFAQRKEPHYFSYPEVAESYYRWGWVKTPQEYLALYHAKGPGQIAGDFSVSYLMHPQAAGRIKEFNSAARIFILLRNPVDRAISHYQMDHRSGRLDRSLAQILENQPPDRLYYHQYVQQGFYHDQVKRYLDLFPPNQVFIRLFEDLSSDPAGLVRQVLEFLGVDPHQPIDTSDRFNVHEAPRFAFLRNRRRWPITAWLNRRLPQPLLNLLRQAAFSRSAKQPFTNERDALREIYQEEIDRLAQLIGRDLSDWKAKPKIQSPSLSAPSAPTDHRG